MEAASESRDCSESRAVSDSQPQWVNGSSSTSRVALTSRPPQVKTYGALSVVITVVRRDTYDCRPLRPGPRGTGPQCTSRRPRPTSMPHSWEAATTGDAATIATSHSPARDEETAVLRKCVVRRVLIRELFSTLSRASRARRPSPSWWHWGPPQLRSPRLRRTRADDAHRRRADSVPVSRLDSRRQTSPESHSRRSASLSKSYPG